MKTLSTNVTTNICRISGLDGIWPLPVFFLLIVASMFGIVSWIYLVCNVGGNSLKCAFIVQSQCRPNVNECPSKHRHLKVQRQQAKKIKNYFLLKSLLKQSASQLSAQTGMFSEIPGNSVKSLDWKVSPCRSSVFASCHVAYSITQMKLTSTFQHFNKDFFHDILFGQSDEFS